MKIELTILSIDARISIDSTDPPFGEKSMRAQVLQSLRVSLFFLIAAVTTGPGTQAKILHVSKSGDGADGLTWETAFHAIGDALTASASAFWHG